MNSDDAAIAFINDLVMQQRLAKHLAMKCFRNPILEDLHADKVPNQKPMPPTTAGNTWKPVKVTPDSKR